MLFSDKDRPKNGGGFFKKIFILFNLLMIVNMVAVKHVEKLQNRKPQQAVADLGGDENDFVNQQERALASIHSDGNKALGVIESDLDHALLNFANTHPSIYGVLNSYRYIIWLAGLLLFVLLRRTLSRSKP